MLPRSVFVVTFLLSNFGKTCAQEKESDRNGHRISENGGVAKVKGQSNTFNYIPQGSRLNFVNQMRLPIRGEDMNFRAALTKSQMTTSFDQTLSGASYLNIHRLNNQPQSAAQFQPTPIKVSSKSQPRTSVTFESRIQKIEPSLNDWERDIIGNDWLLEDASNEELPPNSEWYVGHESSPHAGDLLSLEKVKDLEVEDQITKSEELTVLKTKYRVVKKKLQSEVKILRKKIQSLQKEKIAWEIEKLSVMPKSEFDSQTEIFEAKIQEKNAEIRQYKKEVWIRQWKLKKIAQNIIKKKQGSQNTTPKPWTQEKLFLHYPMLIPPEIKTINAEFTKDTNFTAFNLTASKGKFAGQFFMPQSQASIELESAVKSDESSLSPAFEIQNDSPFSVAAWVKKAEKLLLEVKGESKTSAEDMNELTQANPTVLMDEVDTAPLKYLAASIRQNAMKQAAEINRIEMIQYEMHQAQLRQLQLQKVQTQALKNIASINGGGLPPPMHHMSMHSPPIPHPLPNRIPQPPPFFPHHPQLPVHISVLPAKPYPIVFKPITGASFANVPEIPFPVRAPAFHQLPVPMHISALIPTANQSLQYQATPAPLLLNIPPQIRKYLPTPPPNSEATPESQIFQNMLQEFDVKYNSEPQSSDSNHNGPIDSKLFNSELNIPANADPRTFLPASVLRVFKIGKSSASKQPEPQPQATIFRSPTPRFQAPIQQKSVELPASQPVAIVQQSDSFPETIISGLPRSEIDLLGDSEFDLWHADQNGVLTMGVADEETRQAVAAISSSFNSVCIDRHIHCEYWLSQQHCNHERHQGYMNDICPRSCNSC